jgi:hypothetical protein
VLCAELASRSREPVMAVGLKGRAEGGASTPNMKMSCAVRVERGKVRSGGGDVIRCVIPIWDQELYSGWILGV